MEDRSRLPARAAGRRVIVSFAAVAAFLIASACAVHRVETQSADGTLITEAEIDSLHAVNALELVSRLRPNFLASRGKLSVQPGSVNALPNVYVDEQFYGDATELRNIAASTVESIRLYSASEAQYKYGRGNAAGVIGITTKHR